MLSAAGEEGLRPFGRLTKASVEGLRYRAEDIARSLTKTAVKEVQPRFTITCMLALHGGCKKNTRRGW